MAAPEEDLYVPDRFEGLHEAGSGTLRSIIVPVEEALGSIDRRFLDMRAARRGALMILRGDTGAGKSTFLNTVGLFRKDAVTERIPPTDDVQEALGALESAESPRIIVLEGREALGEVSGAALESAMHAINSFVRSRPGQNTLVVWPTNTDDLTTTLVSLAEELGAEALFGVAEPAEHFVGPPKEEYVRIAERTVAALNEGASLAALGISGEQAVAMANEADTVGRYLALIRNALLSNTDRVRGLLPSEQFRLWTISIAGNDPEGDVAALTRGGYAYADVDRLMTATGANIVVELKKQPETLGILGSVLDARILHVDMVTVLSVARQFGDEDLHRLMRTEGMSTNPDPSAYERLAGSEVGVLLAGQSLGTRRRGSKPGGGTQTAFAGVAKIARINDGALNRAIGRGLRETGLVQEFEVEKSLGTELKFASDLYIVREGQPIRLEVMWRARTSRAEIANYVLAKLGNYGKAIGLLK